MYVFTITRTTNVYSDDVHVDQVFDSGDGMGATKAYALFDETVGWGLSDGNEVTVDLWSFNIRDEVCIHLKSHTVKDDDESEFEVHA